MWCSLQTTFLSYFQRDSNDGKIVWSHKSLLQYLLALSGRSQKLHHIELEEGHMRNTFSRIEHTECCSRLFYNNLSENFQKVNSLCFWVIHIHTFKLLYFIKNKNFIHNTTISLILSNRYIYSNSNSNFISCNN